VHDVVLVKGAPLSYEMRGTGPSVLLVLHRQRLFVNDFEIPLPDQSWEIKIGDASDLDIIER
jgi:hypothetical protein